MFIVFISFYATTPNTIASFIGCNLNFWSPKNTFKHFRSHHLKNCCKFRLWKCQKLSSFRLCVCVFLHATQIQCENDEFNSGAEAPHRMSNFHKVEISGMEIVCDVLNIDGLSWSCITQNEKLHARDITVLVLQPLLVMNNWIHSRWIWCAFKRERK